jgi:hypothetical protein
MALAKKAQTTVLEISSRQRYCLGIFSYLLVYWKQLQSCINFAVVSGKRTANEGPVRIQYNVWFRFMYSQK